MTLGIRFIAALLGASAACGGSDTRPPAPEPSTGNGGTAAGGTSTRGGANAEGGATEQAGMRPGGTSATNMGGEDARAGESGEGGEGKGGAADGGGGSAGEAAAGMPAVAIDPCPSDGGTTAPEDLVTICDPSGAWAAGAPIPVEQGAAGELVGITPDELTLAWSAAIGSVRSFFVADRTATSEPFGAAQDLGAAEVRALAPDGLRLVIESEDASAFLERSREARSDAFGEPSEGAFELVNLDALEGSRELGACVLAPDDLTLYYVSFGPDETDYPLLVSRRPTSGDPWAVGAPLEGCEFTAYGPFAQHPSAVSADGLTLFYFDSARGQTRAAYRVTEDAPFVHFVDLGDRSNPQPNAACDRLYYWSFDEESPTMQSAAAE